MKYKFLILNLIGLLYTQNLYAATSGNCGPKDADGEYTDSCTFTYSDGTLTISGTGKMADWGNGPSDDKDKPYEARPWHDVISDITTISVQGVTNIGNLAFVSAEHLTSLTISEGVTSIGYGAIAFATSLTSVTLPDSVQSLGASSFYHDSALQTFSLGPDSQLKEIGSYAFSGVISDMVIPDGVTIGRGVFEHSVKNGNKIYCTPNTDCLTGTLAKTQNIVPYTKDKSGAYALLDEDGHIITDTSTGNPIYYLSSGDMTAQSNPCTSGYESCATQALNARAEALAAKGKVCNSLESCQALVYADYNGQVLKLNGKDYASLSDLLKGVSMPKRIYTLEEANQVAGPINRISIKYR